MDQKGRQRQEVSLPGSPSSSWCTTAPSSSPGQAPYSPLNTSLHLQICKSSKVTSSGRKFTLEVLASSETL